MSFDQPPLGQNSWHRNVRLCIQGQFNRLERIEDLVGISPRAMHDRISALEACQTPRSEQAFVRGDGNPPMRLAAGRGRVWLGGANGRISGDGHTIAEAERRWAELQAALPAPRDGRLVHLPRRRA